jgi:hypothetical protein
MKPLPSRVFSERLKKVILLSFWVKKTGAEGREEKPLGTSALLEEPLFFL